MNYTLIETSIRNSTSFNVNHRQYTTNAPVVFLILFLSQYLFIFYLTKHLMYHVDYTFSFHLKTVINRVKRIF